jgi:hypothetical protein
MRFRVHDYMGALVVLGGSLVLFCVCMHAYAYGTRESPHVIVYTHACVFVYTITWGLLLYLGALLLYLGALLCCFVFHACMHACMHMHMHTGEPPCNRVHACTRFRVHDYMGALVVLGGSLVLFCVSCTHMHMHTREPPCNRVHACTRFRVHDYMGALVVLGGSLVVLGGSLVLFCAICMHMHAHERAPM